jgi:hypothetical protein
VMIEKENTTGKKADIEARIAQIKAQRLREDADRTRRRPQSEGAA